MLIFSNAHKLTFAHYKELRWCICSIYLFKILSVQTNLATCYRSSRSQVFFKTGILKNFVNFTGKHLCRRLRHRCFPLKFEKYLRTIISQTTSDGYNCCYVPVLFLFNIFVLLLLMFVMVNEKPFASLSTFICFDITSLARLKKYLASLNYCVMKSVKMYCSNTEIFI